MKTLIQENGFEYSSNHRFGNPEPIDEFKPLISFEVDLMLIDQTENISFRITDDNYVQFCCTDENDSHPKIVAQWELNAKNLKQQIHSLLRDYIVGILLFVGFPYKLNNSILYSESEFKSLVEDAEKEYDRLKKAAKKMNKK